METLQVNHSYSLLNHFSNFNMLMLLTKGQELYYLQSYFPFANQFKFPFLRINLLLNLDVLVT